MAGIAGTYINLSSTAKKLLSITKSGQEPNFGTELH